MYLYGFNMAIDFFPLTLHVYVTGCYVCVSKNACFFFFLLQVRGRAKGPDCFR